LIVRGSLNFWTGSTTERNLEESSEEANEHHKLGDVFAQSHGMYGYATYEFILLAAARNNDDRASRLLMKPIKSQSHKGMAY
jgi:hypothetical protein